jgi:hypothetical protein
MLATPLRLGVRRANAAFDASSDLDARSSRCSPNADHAWRTSAADVHRSTESWGQARVGEPSVWGWKPTRRNGTASHGFRLRPIGVDSTLTVSGQCGLTGISARTAIPWRRNTAPHSLRCAVAPARAISRHGRLAGFRRAHRVGRGDEMTGAAAGNGRSVATLGPDSQCDYSSRRCRHTTVRSASERSTKPLQKGCAASQFVTVTFCVRLGGTAGSSRQIGPALAIGACARPDRLARSRFRRAGSVVQSGQTMATPPPAGRSRTTSSTGLLVDRKENGRHRYKHAAPRISYADNLPYVALA